MFQSTLPLSHINTVSDSHDDHPLEINQLKFLLMHLMHHLSTETDYAPPISIYATGIAEALSTNWLAFNLLSTAHHLILLR